MFDENKDLNDLLMDLGDFPECFDDCEDEELEKLCDECEIFKITGEAVFPAFPSAHKDEFKFLIKGDKVYNVIINRKRFSCRELLKEKRMYEFSCYMRDGLIYVASYIRCNKNEPIPSSLYLQFSEFDRERIFSSQCSEREKGIKIAFKIKGDLKCVSGNERTFGFLIDCEELSYMCWIERSMEIGENAAHFIDSHLHLINKQDSLSGIVKRKESYTFEGVLVDSYFYVSNCWENNEFRFVDENYPEHVRESVKEKMSGIPPKMKSEIKEIAKRGTVYPEAETKEEPVYNSVSDLKMKFELCSWFYPPHIQSAIRKTLKDRSLKESQKASVLNILVNTPWGRQYPLNTDADSIRSGLDESHYGLDHLKNELIKLVLSNANKKEKKGMKILLVGAPGVGKTSLVRRFSELYNIPFCKISLNGIDTPYFLKGTPRLYDNAIIGRIMRVVNEVGENALILLDEVDKVEMSGKEGNPYSALYDLLDTDEYFQDDMIEAGVDLSNTVFVLTANNIANVPPAVLDRVEVVFVDGYTPQERKIITSDYVIPKISAQYGIEKGEVLWDEDAVEAVSDRFTLSGGVRDIEKNVVRIAKSVVIKQSQNPDAPIRISSQNLSEFLDMDSCERVHTEKEIAGMKKKFQFFKTEYTPELRKKITDLFADYDSACDDKDKEMIRKRLICMVNILPSESRADYNIAKIRSMLDSTHYGMKDVKERILMHICALKASGGSKAKCILLNGMSGIGKTTICKTLAEALGMPFVKISLNGVTAPETLKGFEATWENSEPGIIVKKLSEISTSTAFVLLDEIDKMSADGAKDPYSALLDLFDNGGGYADKFCDVNFDLSDLFIVATSNSLSTIPVALLDRMEIIELGGYTLKEKTEIAVKCIVPKTLAAYNLTGKLEISCSVVSFIVNNNCRSYGMRDFEKALEKIISGYLLKNDGKPALSALDEKCVCAILGAQPLLRGNVSSNQRPGMARALAVSGNSGTTFAVEVVENMFGDGDEITGLPKQSTSDSIKIAKLLVSRYLNRKLPKLHIHFGEGGIEKDGPSAGITIFTAIYSYITSIPVDSTTGFTGEINLYGDVWAIGGVELKITAAVNAGCKKVIIPYENYIQLMEDGKLGQFECEIIPVKNVEDVIGELFAQDIPEKQAI